MSCVVAPVEEARRCRAELWARHVLGERPLDRQAAPMLVALHGGGQRPAAVPDKVRPSHLVRSLSGSFLRLSRTPGRPSAPVASPQCLRRAGAGPPARRSAVEGRVHPHGARASATDPCGRRWVIRCTHRRDGLAGFAAGTPDLQILDGAAHRVHGADVAVTVTDVRVAAPAAALAEQQRLPVVDRHTLGAWAPGSRPLGELLRAVPPPRRPAPSPDRPAAASISNLCCS